MLKRVDDFFLNLKSCTFELTNEPKTIIMYLKTIFNISLLFVVLSATNAQNAGTLDESFGNNGIVVTNLYDQSETASSIAVDNEGRIVLGGYLDD